jgi:hypothetical protein
MQALASQGLPANQPGAQTTEQPGAACSGCLGGIHGRVTRRTSTPMAVASCGRPRRWRTSAAAPTSRPGIPGCSRSPPLPLSAIRKHPPR